MAVTRGWLTGWDPDDEIAWRAGGHLTARRNLLLSVLSEHVSFAVWTMWSVLVLFLVPRNGFDLDAGERFLLVATPTIVGALLRLPYSRAVTRFGGRTWTTIVTAALFVPAALAFFLVQRPGTPLWLLLVASALAGVGGGTFASSTANVAAFYPRHRLGWALGVNAGGGNLGAAAVQLAGLAVIVVAGPDHPELVVAVYLPLIVLTCWLASRRMDDVVLERAPGALREAARDPHTWWISMLYVGTFGSFIGYGFAFGLVLQTQFGATPQQAVGFTFAGPLLGAFARPLGGLLADRLGGARVAGWAFAALAVATVVVMTTESFGLFVVVFTTLSLVSGLGNGAVYTMIPAVLADRAGAEVTAGGDATAAFARARRLTGAVAAIAGAVGALGGAAINLAFRAAYQHGSGTPAFLAFLGHYACCLLVLWFCYRTRATGPTDQRETGRARHTV